MSGSKTNSDVTRIYLCGSIKKGDADDRPSSEYWTPEHEAIITNNIDGKVKLLNPAKTKISRQDYFVNFGCDIFLVRSSNFLFADLRSEKGIGVGAELMFARQIGIPVIAWLPKNTHYRRDLSDVFGEDLRNWIHPFAFALSDHFDETLEGMCAQANKILSGQDTGVNKSKLNNIAIEKFLDLYPEFSG